MYKLILSWRYFLRRPVAFLAVAAVGLCVFIVVVVMTVMNGLVADFAEKNHQFVGDCVVSTKSLAGFAYYEQFMEQLTEHKSVAAASAVIKGFGLLSIAGSDYSRGIEITGFEPAVHGRVTGFADTLYYRRNEPEKAFVPMYDTDAPGCVVGIDMACQRDQSGGYEHSPYPPRHRLVISSFPLTASGGLAKAGTDLLNTKTFTYSDDSHSGLVRADENMIYMAFDDAQMLCGMDQGIERASAVHIKFREGVALEDTCRQIRQLWQDFLAECAEKPYAATLSNVRVESWQGYCRSVMAAMQKEQVMLIMLFMMLGVITVFIIFVVFYIIVSYKSKDIGILKSIGATNTAIMGIFLLFAVFIGIVGSGLGTAAGCGFLARINQVESWLFENYGWQLWNRSIYAIGDIPNDLRWELVGIVAGCAIAACLLGAIAPAVQAAGKEPARILQVSQLI